jgi:hypothetical protein
LFLKTPKCLINKNAKAEKTNNCHYHKQLRFDSEKQNSTRGKKPNSRNKGADANINFKCRLENLLLFSREFLLTI